MPDVISSEDIMLRPSDHAVPYEFAAPAASASGSNDGALPFGYTISSVVAKVFDKKRIEKTSEILDSPAQVANNVITVALNYPATSGVGRYMLQFICTLNGGQVIDFFADRIVAEVK
jgi:hypothetical protein